MGIGRLLFGSRDAIGAVTDGVRSIRNTFAKELDVETAAKIDQELAKLQGAVNAAEAQHPSVFVAGWRPAIGWTCALAMFWHFIVAQLLGAWLTLPALDISDLWPVIVGMLGLSGMRSWEKYKKVHDEH